MGQQGRRKAARRAADMTVVPADEKPTWRRPPPDECHEVPVTLMPLDSEGTTDRVILRMDVHAVNDAMVEFALIQQAFDRGAWRDVISADSCHDEDVHLHFYSRRTDARVGEREVLLQLNEDGDLETGYETTYDRIIGQWEDNKRRWRDA